ncbi:ankyrin repeat domain-containing protein [Cryptosporangium arvum]|uniref:Ankyrin repeat-containing protein n=1 Tax=Cryptosporangium arvum DSM 44712 TaxID=927661 RepID=A0A010ZT67_9ACTN|nr:ankyrin repeat domain-containing protein [Cryptosporangium arvum]EXG81889.1 ankyrin repeat-containing protein [Cryptosporangium arvum DSM 44712]
MDTADEFCRLACLTYSGDDGPQRWDTAARLLAEEPGLTRGHVWAAAAAARADEVSALLDADPSTARAAGGPFGWEPLLYLVYSRVPGGDAVAAARSLLAAGADPNSGFVLAPNTFSAITGVFGSGEQNQPRHPRWRELARLLLDAGADPNDEQALYNCMFGASDEHLELLFSAGLADRGLLRIQLRWAVEHDLRDRVRLLTEHGVDVRSPYEGDGPAWAAGDGRTPVALARLCGNTEIADYLLAHGAEPPPPDPVADLIAAVFRGENATAPADVVARAVRERPGLVVWAAAAAPAAVERLVELGFDVNALGRADAPVEQEWETALHHAAGAGDVDLTRRLLALGADPGVRDRRFDATPLDWARHLNRAATAELLG